jgi:hypothetical protein
MAAVLDTTSVVDRGGRGRGRRVEEPCAASDGAAAAAAAAAVAAVVAVNNLQNLVDRDSRNMGVDIDILDSRRRYYYQTTRIHARRLPAIPIQRCPGSTVVVAAVVAVVVMVVDNHPGHTAAEAPSSDLVEVVRDDSLVAAVAVARSKVGSIRS